MKHLLACNLALVVLLGTPASPSAVAIATEREYERDDPAATWKESDSVDGRWNEMQIGPFIASVLPTPAGVVAKGLSIRVGEQDEGAVCYDLETMTLRTGWTGGLVKFSPRRYGIVSSPTIAGNVAFQCSKSAYGDARVKYRGLYQHGPRAVLSYTVNAASVLETPSMLATDVGPTFVRDWHLPADRPALDVTVLDGAGGGKVLQQGDFPYLLFQRDASVTVLAAAGSNAQVVLRTQGDTAVLSIPAATESTQVRLLTWTGSRKEAATFIALAKALATPSDAAALVKPASELWPERLVTQGTVGDSEAPLVIDTVTIPFENPYRALMFISGHDFFSSGDMAACTLHGDVWLVQGVDDKLEKIVWKRFATGLHQPLGLRIVNDKVYVLGKDQITRLHDRNGDGEADFYENFNNGGQTSKGGHDYASCLETDPEGNFYYIRAHEGVCRVSKDGTKHESIAKGFRNPIGLGVGPDGTVTAAPQEGTWTPTSFVAEVREGGFYGFGGPQPNSDRPLGYDPPLCWIPRDHDSSSGGQVWVTSDRWAPLKGQVLHLSYGRCQMLLVMREKVDGAAQGGTYKFPLFFESGVMRGRFSPRDGQLYVSGLRGWQCAATKDGCIQRVRYTGKPLYMPIGLHVRQDGVALTFSQSLDPDAASDPDNYHVEQWNYRYTGNYGSKDYKLSDPKRTGRDEVEIFDARLAADGRTVLLELEDVQPVMQMGITYAIDAADGTPMRDTIYNTINRVPSE